MLHYYDVKSQATTTLHLLQTIFLKKDDDKHITHCCHNLQKSKEKKIEERRGDKHIYGATFCK
jgi:hypothetical protein